MKKAFITLAVLVLVAALAFGGVTVYLYQNTTSSTIPNVTVSIAGTSVSPVQAQWQQPVLGGLLYKDVGAAFSADATPLGAIEPGGLTIVPPMGYSSSMCLSQNGSVIYEGESAGFAPSSLTDEGEYEIEVTCALPKDNVRGYGSFVFKASFYIPAPAPPQPEQPPAKELGFYPGETQLYQGDIFAMEVRYLPLDIVPQGQTDLGPVVFVPTGEGCWFAAVPIGNISYRSLCQPGEYPVTVTAGEDYHWETTVTVLEFGFIEQDLIIDTTDPVISEANSAEAYQQFNNTIPPLFSLHDEEKYWEGVFIPPVEGRLSTEFGLTRYTNGDYSNPSRHPAVDIAAAEGTPVQAPNHGRVLFADYLLNTGYTLVIEHGGGLKTLYYHMLELNVQEGDMVKQGDIVGAVGTTGYSTGPHLHYEVRIGRDAVSPTMLSQPDCGLYSLESQDTASPEAENG